MRKALLPLIVTLAILGQLTAPSLAAQPDNNTVFWRKVGAWTVAIDKTIGNKCYIYTDYEGGYILRLGFSAPGEESPAYLAIASASWTSLEPGKDYDIAIRFDHNKPWSAAAKAVTFGGDNGTVALTIGLKDVNFFDEFSRKLGMRVFYAGKQIVNLSLRGSSQAINEILNCQEAVDKYVGNQQAPKDPFDDQNPKDPFGNHAPKNAKDPFSL